MPTHSISTAISSSSVSLLLVALITTAVLPLIPTHPSPSPITPPPLSAAQTTPSPLKLAEIQEDQLKNIADALIGAGDFGGWADVLSSADPSAFPLTATLFIPSDDATTHYASAGGGGKSFDPSIIPYHIVPQRLTFSDLRRFATHTRLPTLLPSNFIVITNNSASNFTVDDSQITQADIFTNAAFAVHGINNILNYTVYGGGLVPPPPGNTNPQRLKPTTKPPKKRNPVFPGEITASVRSKASCLCSWSLMVLVILVAATSIQDLFSWNFQIHQNLHEHRQC